VRTEPGTARGSPTTGFVRKQRRPPDNRDDADRTRGNGEVDSAYLRAVARRSRDLSQECFDLTVAGELRALGEELDAKARQLDGQHAESRGTLTRRLSEALANAQHFARRLLQWRPRTPED
jgi:hypothetical protein